MVISMDSHTAERDRILNGLNEHMPAGIWDQVSKVIGDLKHVVGGYFKAQFKIMGVVYVILVVGLFILRVNYVLLVAFVIAFLDMLPFFGTGTVLGPWAAGCFLLGDTQRGLALLAIYGAAFLAHTLLEPRLLAGQVGLPPITALLAMYVGFHFMGVGGMVLLPVVLLLVKQLQDAGVVRIWR